MAVQAWRFRDGFSPAEVPESELGTFDQDDCAYVVLKTDTPQQVFIWAGSAAPEASQTAAAARADELLTTLPDGASVAKLLQGEETEEFNKLFSDKEDDTAVDDAPSGPTAAASKKKRKKKKKGGAGNNNNGGGAAAATAAGPADADAEEETAPEETAAVPVAEKATEQQDVAPAIVADAAKQEEQTETEPENADAVEELTAAVAETEEKATEPEAVEEKEEVVIEPKEISAPSPPAPAAALVAETKASPKPAAAATPAKTAAPTTTSTQPTTTPSGNGPVSYLADSAKAWSAADAAGKISDAVKVLPGSKFFPLEELKALRVESGIDMATKEAYLSDEEFIKVFKKDRDAWNAQPAWRRLMQKKEVGLW